MHSRIWIERHMLRLLIRKILRGDKTYYQLSVDFDYSKDIDLSGERYWRFCAHPKTQNTVLVASGSSVIDVDSTIGFQIEDKFKSMVRVEF